MAGRELRHQRQVLPGGVPLILDGCGDAAAHDRLGGCPRSMPIWRLAFLIDGALRCLHRGRLARFPASLCSISRACAPARRLRGSLRTGAPTSSRSRCPSIWRSGEGLGGARHGPDFQNLHRNKRAHDAQSQVAAGRGGVPPAGGEGRRGGRELPARREDAPRHRLRGAEQDQSAARLCQHLRLRPGRALRGTARGSTRSRRAWAG